MTRTAEEITAEILADLQGIRDAHGAPVVVDLGAFVRLDATSGHYLDPMADETLHELAAVAGSRAQAVRAWIVPALRESPIEGLTILD
jgi:hypothetical protein